MSEPIHGKVARVLNEREIVINVGTVQGVKVDMYFDIIDPKGLDIKDPDTKEVLGSFKRSKVRVRVTQVQEKLSIATTYRSKHAAAASAAGIVPSGGPSHLGPYARSLMPANPVIEYETLKKTRETPGELDEEDSLVKTGDPAVQVTENNRPEQAAIHEKIR